MKIINDKNKISVLTHQDLFKQFLHQNRPQNKWYDNAEPHTQIKIMKLLAKHGILSKTQVAEKLEMKIGAVDMIMSRMSKDNYNLIQRKRKKFITSKSVQHVLFSLTVKSINVLLQGHYEDKNKPYLSIEEFKQFENIYDEMFSNDDVDYPEWKTPNIKKDELQDIYLDSNHQMFFENVKDEHKDRVKKLIDEFFDLIDDLKEDNKGKFENDMTVDLNTKNTTKSKKKSNKK